MHFTQIMKEIKKGRLQLEHAKIDQGQLDGQNIGFTTPKCKTIFSCK